MAIDWLRTALTSVYLAAAVSFGAGILRDWQLVHHVAEYQSVFGAMYTVALAASFSVNAVTLGRGFHHHPLRLWILVVASVTLFLLLVRLWQPMTMSLFWWMLPVPALYVLGALHARRLLDAGHVLVGRLRDGVSSLFTVVLVAVGLGAESFSIGVLMGSGLIAFAASKLLKPRGTLAPDVEVMRWRHYVGAIFYANIASILVNAWALWANSLEGTVFGVATPVAVRVAVYAFQLFSMPSVLLPRWKGALAGPVTLRWLAWLCIALAVVSAARLPIEFSIVLLPFCALAALYTSVLLMHSGKVTG